MKTNRAEAKNGNDCASGKPIEVFNQGSVCIPIECHTNVIPLRDRQREITYREPDAIGTRKALVKYQSESFTVAYYLGS